MPNTDAEILWTYGWAHLNATLLFSWLSMAMLVGGSWLVTRRLSRDAQPPPWQNFLESVVELLRSQIAQIGELTPEYFLPVVGTLFLYISTSSLLSLIPGIHAATSSLSTTAALATCVFVAVPLYGVRREGLRGYLHHYVSPTFIMLPFHVISEISRTVALAVRLFGNIMSGSMLVAMLLSIAPFFMPVLAQLLELLLSQVQAYIFAVLAMVYIASAAAESPKGSAHHG